MLRATSTAAFLLVLLCSCGKLREPEFDHIDNIKMDKLSLANTTISFDAHYLNPNNRGGKLKKAEGDAWVDSTYVGHFTVDSLVTIPAKAIFRVPVNLKIDVKYLLKYQGLKNEVVLLRVKGTARVGSHGIYKTIPVQYEGKHNLAELIK